MEAVESPNLELRDYWAVLVRRKRGFLIAFTVVMGISLALAVLLPPVYRSEATILIERQSIPKNIVESTITSYVEESIQQILKRLTTYENLLDIAATHNLYADEIQSNERGVVSKLSDSIEVQMIDVKTSTPDGPADRVATIAFTVAFSAPDPKTAQVVTQDLAERYLDEHKAAREAQAANVESFLEEESQKLKDEIGELEKKLADFKRQELKQLPELMDMNLRLYENAERDIASTQEDIRETQDQIEAYRSELSLTDPYKDVMTEEGERVLSASERLSLLTSQYLQATSRYSAEHPDVLRLSREIRALSMQTGAGARTDELMRDLTRLQEELRQARQKYADGHPEVERLERSVAAVERGFQSALVGGGAPKELAAPPDNPRYVALKTSLDAAESNLTAQHQKLTQLEEKLASFEQRLFNTPVVERDYKSLSRDYANAQEKYADLRNKQLEARVAQQLEAGSSAQKFVLLSRAFYPSDPDSPNRLGILLLGGLLAFAAGLGCIAAQEYLDKTVRGIGPITEIFGAPPLVVIPQMRAVALD